MSFHTDSPSVPSCDRNNCRCGDNTNCMYYNSAGPGQAHYNYVAVQGAGDPQSPYYGCMRKSMDIFNAERLYGDHAGAVVGGYADKQPVQGSLHFSGSSYHESPVQFCSHGQPMHVCPFGCGRWGHHGFLGLPKWLWVLVIVFAIMAFAVKSGVLPKFNIADRRSQMLVAVVLAFLWLSFFF